jgi:cytochrome c oxidase subunit 1
MLGLGGAGGLVNMSYQLNETVHNTQWVTGHFHLIFGGAIVIMYFMVAYELWPQLARSAPLPTGWIRLQLWLWFIGMLVLSLPWHWVGLLGQPRRMAYFDYRHPALEPQAWTVTMSTFGGLILAISALLFVVILARAHRKSAEPAAFTFGVAAHPGLRPPPALNGFALWIAMMIGLTVVNYGYPIVQLALLKEASVPIVPIGSR